jgi:Fe-S-cluster-containing hydrogenase component 2
MKIRVYVDSSVCRDCKMCVRYCKIRAISSGPNGAIIDQNKCNGCKLCMMACAFGAIKTEEV